MSKFLRYEPCPRCTEKGRDSRGDNCAVYSDGGSHCFSCGFHKFPKHYVKPTEKVNGTASMPSNVSREIPARAWGWLLQYGLPMSHWKSSVWWREEDSRLVFTVGQGPEFSLGRFIQLAVASVEGRGGKDGHVPTARKWRAWGDCHKTPHIFGAYSESKEIVLVEDLISANKVAAAGIPAIPLFGTRVFASAIPCLRHVGLPIVLWLDKDQEGTMARKAAGLATMTGLPVRYIVTNDDPKTLPIVKIKELLNVPY